MVRASRKLFALAAALLLLSATLLLAKRALSTGEPEISEVGVNVSSRSLLDALNDVQMENIKEHVKYFSSLGSRVTGYPGSYLAAEYIAN